MPAVPRGSGESDDSSRRLPPYQALFAVDVRDFSGYRGRDHEELTRRIPRILAAAFDRAGLEEVWSEEIWHRVIGDSYVAGFRSAVLPLLLNPLLGALQEQLRHENRTDAIGDPPRPIRMRVSVHVGPATEPSGDDDSDGSGEARIEVHRLLDADVVKELLSRADDETCVAAIISQRAFVDAVVSGYAGEKPTLYVPAPVKVKKFEAIAMLRVPNPTGELIARGFLPAHGDHGDEGKTHTTSDVARGDATQGGDSYESRIVGVGSARDVGNVVTGTQGSVYLDGRGGFPGKGTPRRRRPRHDG